MLRAINPEFFLKSKSDTKKIHTFKNKKKRKYLISLKNSSKKHLIFILKNRGIADKNFSKIRVQKGIDY